MEFEPEPEPERRGRGGCAVVALVVVVATLVVLWEPLAFLYRFFFGHYSFG